MVVSRYQDILVEIFEIHVGRWLKERATDYADTLRKYREIFRDAHVYYAMTDRDILNRFLREREGLLTHRQREAMHAFSSGKMARVEITEDLDFLGFRGIDLESGEKIRIWNIDSRRDYFKYDVMVGYIYPVEGKWVLSPLAYFIPRILIPHINLKGDTQSIINQLNEFVYEEKFDVFYDGFARKEYAIKFSFRDYRKFSRISEKSRAVYFDKNNRVFLIYNMGRVARLLDRNPLRPQDRSNIYRVVGTMMLYGAQEQFTAFILTRNINQAMAILKLYEGLYDEAEVFEDKGKVKIDPQEEFQKQKKQDIEDFYRNLGEVSEEEYKFYHNLEERFKSIGARHVLVEEILKFSR